MSTQEQQQQPKQDQTEENKEQQLDYNTIEEYTQDIQHKLSFLLSKDNFLNSKYFIQNVINEKLCISYQVLYSHKKFQKLLESQPFTFENSKQNGMQIIHNRNLTFQQAVQSCNLINYDEQNGTVSPKFEFERKSISVSIPTYQVETFREFLKTSPVYKVNTIKTKETDGGENEKNIPNIEVSYTMNQLSLVINCDSPQTATELFQWLKSSEFQGQPITNIYVEYYNYFVEAYRKIFEKYPISYRKPFNQQQYLIQQQYAQMQYLQQYQAQQNYTQKKHYKKPYNNQQNHNGQQRFNNNGNQNQYNNQKPRYNNSNNSNNNNKHYNNKNKGQKRNQGHNNQHQKPRVYKDAPNIKDDQLFPSLATQVEQVTVSGETKQE